MFLDNSTNGYETFYNWIPGLTAPTKITLWSILLVWSLLANILVIAVVYCNQNLRTNMNYLIVNMAVSDLLVPLITMPIMILSEMEMYWEPITLGVFEVALCKLVPFLSELSPFVSSINLVIIALQKILAVVYPIRIQVLTRKTRWILISIPWIVATALLSPYFYTSKPCTFPWPLQSWTGLLIIYSMQTAIGFVIPLITIIVSYVVIQYKLREGLNNVMDLLERETIRSRRRRNRQIFGMSVTIIVIFTICWGSFTVFNLLIFTQTDLLTSWLDLQTVYKMSFAFWYLYYLLAAINPCIYFVFLREFRQGLKKLCRRKSAKANQPIPRHIRPPGRGGSQEPTCTSRIDTMHFSLVVNINTRFTRTPGGYNNKDPTCTPLHINTTSV